MVAPKNMRIANFLWINNQKNQSKENSENARPQDPRLSPNVHFESKLGFLSEIL